MQALIVIDAQNEFAAGGKRPVPDHLSAIEQIRRRVDAARKEGRPIAWVRHHNKPKESAAFVPGSWGAEFFADFGPRQDEKKEALFEKDVYGAFTGSRLGEWLSEQAVDSILLVGFYTHGCLATTAREAIMKDLITSVDPDGTRACAIEHPALGRLTEEEVRRSALLHLTNMGALIEK